MADNGRVRSDRRDSPFVDFGTVESKIGYQGCGRYPRRRRAATATTGNSNHFAALSGCTRNYPLETFADPRVTPAGTIF